MKTELNTKRQINKFAIEPASINTHYQRTSSGGELSVQLKTQLSLFSLAIKIILARLYKSNYNWMGQMSRSFSQGLLRVIKAFVEHYSRGWVGRGPYSIDYVTRLDQWERRLVHGATWPEMTAWWCVTPRVAVLCYVELICSARIENNYDLLHRNKY